MWYYEYKDTTIGPVTEEVIQQLVHAGIIGAATLVCRDGQSDWLPFEDIPLSKLQPNHDKKQLPRKSGKSDGVLPVAGPSEKTTPMAVISPVTSQAKATYTKPTTTHRTVGWQRFALAGGAIAVVALLVMVLRSYVGSPEKTTRNNFFIPVQTASNGSNSLGVADNNMNTVSVSSEVSAFITQFTATSGVKLIPISAGKFTMGSPASELKRDDNEGPQTRVTISRPFFLGATDVTEAQWAAVTGRDPSHTNYLKDITKERFDAIAGDDRGDYHFFRLDALPVQMVSWDDAMAFCKMLNERERSTGQLPTGWQFTLPTEAQWEYACRAGTTGTYAGDLDAMAWYVKSCGNRDEPHPVETKKPNAWGLYDMHGNVWEWCLDWFGNYPGGALTDPTGPSSGSYRVFRGGSCNEGMADCRSAARNYYPADYYNHDVGFRVALCEVQ